MTDAAIIIGEWENIKRNFRKKYKINRLSYQTWIEPLAVDSVKDNVITILIHSEQREMLKYISDRFTAFFEVMISEMMGRNYSVQFVLDKGNHEEGKTLNR